MVEKKYKDKDIFYKEYIENNKSLSELSEEWGNSTSTLHRWRKKHNIPKYRDFTDYQKEVITGLLMGDGSINTNLGGNPRLEVGSITSEYLHYLNSDIFPVLGKNINLVDTANERAEKMQKSGFSPNAVGDNYSDFYIWYSECNPHFEEFAKWYSTGKKVWPENINLTPTVLKHWYCGDGNKHDNELIKLYMSNEVESTDKVSTYFESAGLPVPKYETYERKRLGGKICYAIFTVAQSKELWEYMGEPFIGFEYKWP